MDPRARRILITVLVIAFAAIVILPAILRPATPPTTPAGATPGGAGAAATTPSSNETAVAAETDADEASGEPGQDSEGAAPPPATGDEQTETQTPEATPAPAVEIKGLHAVAPSGSLSAANPPASIGFSTTWNT